MTDKDQHYRTLGLEPGAPLGAIREAYRDLVKIWHPDRFPNDPRLQRKVQEQLKLINAAYHALLAEPSSGSGGFASAARDHEESRAQRSGDRAAPREAFSGARDEPISSSAVAADGYVWFFRIAKILAVLLSLNLVRMLFVNCGVE